MIALMSVAEVMHDMEKSYSLNCADAIPGTLQTVDHFHAIQLLTRTLGKMRCAEVKSREEKCKLLGYTKYMWLKRSVKFTEGQAARRMSFASKRLLTTRTMTKAVKAICTYAIRGEAADELDRTLS